MLQQVTDEVRIADRHQDLRRFCWLLILAAIVPLILSEVTVRATLTRLSKVENRIDTERRAAVKISRGAGPEKTVLVVGNSLLLEGVNFPVLRQGMAPQFATSRYVIEATSYLDWYYGLRTLYNEGSRPDIVVVTLDLTDMVRNAVRGEYFAYYLMMPRDALNVSRDAALSATQTFSLLLGRFSAFYGTRSETRKFVLAKLVPGVRDLVPYVRPVADTRPIPRNVAVDVAGKRLAELDALVRRHGCHLIFVVPATTDPLGPGYLRVAGHRVGVPVLVPMESDSLSSADFRDGYHLNPPSADRFTAALAPALHQEAAALSTQIGLARR